MVDTIKNAVEYIDIENLVLLENNPRTITKENMQKLVDSIRDNKDYFEARPILCSDRTGKNVILAGNQRYRAAKILGMDKVPVVVFHGISEEKEKEIIIRDNVELGDWDMDILANEWDSEDLAKWGLDMPDVGLGDNIIEDLKNSDYIEKENYFIKKPFVVIFYDETTKDKLEKLIGKELGNDAFDAKYL